MLRLTDEHSQQGEEHVRIVVESGGPGRMEFIIKADREGAQLSVWNPFRHEWAVLKLVGQGDSR